MDRLWAPWRVKYNTTLDKKDRRCVFCKILNEKKDQKNFIFERSKHAFAVLNIYPYNNGHCLIVSNRHVGDLEQLKGEEKQDMLELLEKTKSLVDRVLKPKGYNIGMNLGRVAGAGFPGHLHIHLVPRWAGDVNFMPTISHTRVISQSLMALYKKLKDAYQKRD